MSDTPARRIDRVEPGLYRIRLVAGGPWVAAQITIQDGMIYLSINGEPAILGITESMYFDIVAELTAAGDAFRNPIIAAAWFGHRINDDEYHYLIAVSRWAREHAPDHPMARPEKPIKPQSVPINSLF